MIDTTKDVFAEAAELALKKFPPRLVTITQDISQLESLYPKGGDGKSAQAKPLLAFTVGNEDIFAAVDKAQALALANRLTKPVPAYVLGDVEQVKDQYLNRPWGKSKETLQQRLNAVSDPGYLAGWQD